MMTPNNTAKQSEQCFRALGGIQDHVWQKPETVRVGSVTELTQGAGYRFTDGPTGFWGHFDSTP